MSPFLLLILFLLVFACGFGYIAYRNYAEKQAREKRRKQFHDRV